MQLAGIPRNLLRRAMAGVLPAAIAARRWKGDFSLLVNTGMKQEFPLVSQYVRPGMLASRLGYVKEDLALQELRRIKDLILTSGNNCEISWSIGGLLAWKSGCKSFTMIAEKGSI